MDKRDECKLSFEEASKASQDDTKTRVFTIFWEQHGGYLLTGHAVSGV
jgi:hypothetical protein